MTNPNLRRRSVISTAARVSAPRALRAVDYLRMSTEKQKQGYGIASQARKNGRHIAGKGWDHVGTYKDEGVSGSKEMGERPDFDRRMEAAKLDEFDGVVGEKGDRIGRVGRAFWRWVWVLEDMGIFVAITNRNIDNTTPEGRAQMRREADYAETERENIRSRTQGGLQGKAEEAGSPHIGGKPPYGYGSTNTASKYFNEWVTQGIWADLDLALAEVEPVPVPSPELVPAMRIEGRVDPRVMLVASSPSHRTLSIAHFRRSASG